MNLKATDFRPPKIAQLFVLVAVVLHWGSPLRNVFLYSNSVIGVLVGITGFLIMFWAWWLFRQSETAICPTAKTDHLVTTGIYRFSRNPMYLGIIGMLLGTAIIVGTLPFYIAVIAYFSVINFGFCPYEETKLCEEIGENYIVYKTRVRRWL